MTVRYAVVGAGWISQIAFMPGTFQTGNSRMTAIVSGSAENARKLAGFYGIEQVYPYEAYDEMLASDVVDAVYIALPNSLHADYAIRAARAGKHVLVDKYCAYCTELFGLNVSRTQLKSTHQSTTPFINVHPAL